MKLTRPKSSDLRTDVTKKQLAAKKCIVAAAAASASSAPSGNATGTPGQSPREKPQANAKPKAKIPTDADEAPRAIQSAVSKDNAKDLAAAIQHAVNFGLALTNGTFTAGQCALLRLEGSHTDAPAPERVANASMERRPRLGVYFMRKMVFAATRSCCASHVASTTLAVPSSFKSMRR